MVLPAIEQVNAAGIGTDLPEESELEDVPPSDIPKFGYGDDDHYIRLHGQINKGYLGYDDGQTTQGYFPVDNANSSTRLGVDLFRRMDADTTIRSNFEAEWAPYSTNDISQINNRPDWDDAFMWRKAEVWVDSKTYGRLWLGQGSMASDGTAEVDLSGTGVAGYSQVSGIAGGQLFRTGAGALSDISVNDVYENYDGAGRRLRVRYDSPDFNGLVIGTSVGTRIIPEPNQVTSWDISAKYNKSLGDFDVSGALAYRNTSAPVPGLNGSFSTLHVPTGISLTISAGARAFTSRTGKYLYGKLGHQVDYFGIGHTAFSVDAYLGENIDVANSKSVSFGFQAVQNVDAWSTELYIGIRSYQYDNDISNYQDGTAVLFGSRFRF